jgi:hypothetical protein
LEGVKNISVARIIVLASSLNSKLPFEPFCNSVRERQPHPKQMMRVALLGKGEQGYNDKKQKKPVFQRKKFEPLKVAIN